MDKQLIKLNGSENTLNECLIDGKMPTSQTPYILINVFLKNAIVEFWLF